MANIESVNLDYFWKWEGGLSKDPSDPAAQHPVPDGTGYHTNKGITWKTFKANASKLGYSGTVSNFKKMPKTTWLKIYKHGFWDAIKAGQIESQAIAEFLVDWAWGSGPSTATKKLQEYLNTHGAGLNIDGKIGPITLGVLHDLIAAKGERIVFEDLDRLKRGFLKPLRSFKAHGLGWYNRMDDFREYAVKIIPS